MDDPNFYDNSKPVVTLVENYSKLIVLAPNHYRISDFSKYQVSTVLPTSRKTPLVLTSSVCMTVIFRPTLCLSTQKSH